MRLLLLHNPTAGQGDMPRDALVEMFEACGHEVAYRSTKEDGFNVSNADQAEATVVCGGDGTVTKAARAMFDALDGAPGPLAVVPLGTANNIAHALGLMAAPEVIARGLAQARERRVDLGIAEGPWGRRFFLEAVGLGMIADLIAEGSARDLEGEARERFVREAPRRLLAEAEPKDWDVVIDGKRLAGNLLLLEVLNIPVAGPSLRLIQPERAGDGAFDIGFLRPERRAEMMAWLDTDRGEGAAAVEVVCGREVRFTWAGASLRIDDFVPDPPAEPAGVVLRTGREPLRVLVPPETHEEER
jgi:diacylglycerol kinase (ATP)